MEEPKPTEPRIATIKLDEATRKRILTELGIHGQLDWIPTTIHVTRVNAAAIGAKITHPNPWVLVMV